MVVENLNGKKWDTVLEEIREDRNAGRVKRYQWAIRLNWIYTNQDFLSWCETNRVVPEEYLEKETDELFGTNGFRSFIRLLEEYPDEQSWLEKSVSQMIAEIRDKKKNARGRKQYPTYKSKFELERKARNRAEHRAAAEQEKRKLAEAALAIEKARASKLAIEIKELREKLRKAGRKLKEFQVKA